MKSFPIKISRVALLATLAAAVSGCIMIKISADHHADRRKAATTPYTKPPDGGGPTPALTTFNSEPQVPAEEPPGVATPVGTQNPGTQNRNIGDPSGNFGTLNQRVASVPSNTQNTGCFKANQGWNKYFTLLGYFAGPNTNPVPGLPNFTNTANSTGLKIQTCNLTNVFWGTSLQTGIVIVRDDNPYDCKCFTNAGPACTIFSQNLSIGERPLDSCTYYRVTIYYKSTSLPPGQTNVAVDWQYLPP
jgi:hypothetical protein